MLTKENYKEQEVKVLDPDSLGLKACHHIDHSSSIIVLDGIVQ
jgi:Ni,Fe-hydrogenase maturation factor